MGQFRFNKEMTVILIKNRVTKDLFWTCVQKQNRNYQAINPVCWTFRFPDLRGLKVIALKQTCVFLRIALDLPGHLVSLGAAFFLSRLKPLYVMLQQRVATSAALKWRETLPLDFMCSSWDDILMLHVLLNMSSLPEYFCMTCCKKY